MKHKHTLIAILILTLLTVFIFRNYLFGGLVPFPANLLVSFYSPWKYYPPEGYPHGPPNKPIGFDILRNFYPYRNFSVEQMKSGQWPLWNPYNFSGNIHLATYQAAVFYPLNIFYFFLPLIDAWSILVIIQPILAGLFMYLFLKEINLSEKASFFGGLVLAFSGWMIAWMEESLVIEHSALWLPLILYAIERIGKKISPTNIALLVFAASSSVLAGFFQSTFYVFAATIAWIIFRLRTIKILLASFLFTFLISAIQILPAIEAYFQSVRGIIDVKFLFENYLVRPWELVAFLVSDFWGNPGSYNYFGRGFYHERVFYLGIPALLFALYALFLKKQGKVLTFFKWFSLIVLLLGFFPFGWLLYFSRLPLVSTMIPTRIFFLSTFGFSALAAFGVDFFLKKEIDWKIWKNLLLTIGAVFLCLWIFVIYHKFMVISKDKTYAIVSLRNLILPTGLLIGTIALIYVSRIKKKFKVFSFLGLTVLSIFSSVYFANKFFYFSERRFVFPEVEVITKLKEISGINRVWGYGDGNLQRNFNAFYGLYSPEGYEALFPRRYGELMQTQTSGGKISAQIWRSDTEIKQVSMSEKEGVLDSWYRRRLLSLLGVKYIFEAKEGEGEGKELLAEKRFPKNFFRLVWEDQKFKIWEYKEALPRAFLAYDYLVEPNSQKIADYLFDKNFDLGKKIILEEEPDLKITRGKINGVGKVDLISYTPNKVELETSSSAPAFLFLSDNYYPGWKAIVDGKETKIYRADYAFRAVLVPERNHKVVFSYDPKVFFWSLRISVIALILFIGWLVIIWIKQK